MVVKQATYKWPPVAVHICSPSSQSVLQVQYSPYQNANSSSIPAPMTKLVFTGTQIGSLSTQNNLE